MLQEGAEQRAVDLETAKYRGAAAIHIYVYLRVREERQLSLYRPQQNGSELQLGGLSRPRHNIG